MRIEINIIEIKSNRAMLEGMLWQIITQALKRSGI